MKQKYVALKMYLVGMTVGLFILGWSAVANTDAAQTTTGNQTAASTVTTSSTVTTQTRSSSQQSFVTQPRIRTRTS